MSKLDRLLISHSFMDSSLDFKVTALPRGWFDHAPLLLHYEKDDYGPVPFKFFHLWLQQDGIMNAYYECLKVTALPRGWFDHTPLLLHYEKDDYGPAWNVLVKSKEVSRMHEVRSRINAIDENINSGIASEEEKHDRKNLIKECDDNQKLEEMYTAQKDLLKDDVVEAMRHAFDSFTIPKGANSSFITLIPKVANPVHIKYFWHISLIGMHYKIVGRILANRLAKVINNVTSHEKSYFISGRQILQGPLMLSEIMSWYKKKKQKLMLFKVDFEKAFDTISWKYLDHMLTNVGFGNKWRRWIQMCLHSARASVWVNGSPSCEFSIKRFLGQGDPLSPFFFIIVMGGLHLALKDAVSTGLIRDIKMGDTGLNISHLFFADNVVILSYWNKGDMNNIIRILHAFYLASGLRINISKSHVCGLGVSSIDTENMALYMGCSSGNIPFSYLGLPIATRSHINNFLRPSLSPSSRWSKLIPRKVDVFIWNLILVRPPTRLNLSLRGIEISSIACPSCNGGMESNDHVFSECDTASNIWRLVCTWTSSNMPSFSSSSDSLQWFKNWRASKESKDRV
nr:RNA-directed DNA polymerase, eukaryota, reverse transcriptase zinc-binding domain protein [Tanacetum cinerariifolium]